ncbi:MAG: response regulator [Candidatus Omnitrophica bacterium]|nr:response regulator [Candidatus Omnitrophota bacterium]
MKKKILIVDDEKDITLTLKELFLSKGYDALVAFTGKEAERLLNQKGLDLILLDIQMPDINGVEILRQVKKKFPEIKTVVLTGFLEEYKSDIEKIGCDAILNKPFSIKTLIKIVDSTLSEKKDDGEPFSTLIDNVKILAKAGLLFIEPNEIMYSPKFAYFRNPKRCKGEYLLKAAYTEEDILKELKDPKTDIVLSNINMFRLYKLADKFNKSSNPPKDVILYGLSSSTRSKDLDKAKGVSFIDGLFDPVTAIVLPEEMDKLGKIVRATAIAHNLYIKVD